jgi:hypothetical protein
MMVRMLTMLSIESCTMETKIKKAAGNSQAEPLDTGQLGGAVGSSRGKAEGKREGKREREREITQAEWNKNATEAVCLLWGFPSALYS